MWGVSYGVRRACGGVVELVWRVELVYDCLGECAGVVGVSFGV